jgi:magnesium-transporting ATPase (P-type)
LGQAKTDSAALDNPHAQESAEVARALGSDVERGLGSEEAARRLAEHGPNVLRATPARPAWRRWLVQFQDPLVYLLLLAVVIALVAWQFEGRQGMPVDALVIALVIGINAVLGYVQEAKAESAVAALTRMTEAMSTVVRAGKPERVPSAALVPGDVLLLAEGDAVGADARLISATSLRVQEASLTGESEAVLKDTASLSTATSLGDRLDMVFKGTAVVLGSGRALVTATGMATEMGAIAQLLEATEEGPTPLQREVGHIGRMLGVVVVLIAVVVVGTILLLSEIRGVSDVIAVLLLGVSLAVAAVPEGLPAILSVVLALGVQRMARRNAIVKKLSSVETLGSASVICSDKTGTLTRSEMMIERVMTASGGTRVSGAGYVPKGGVEHEGRALTPGALLAEQIVVLSGGSLAGNAYLQQRADGAWEIGSDRATRLWARAGAAFTGDADLVDQLGHRLGASVGHGRRPGNGRRHGACAAQGGGARDRYAHVAGRVQHRPHDGVGDTAEHAFLSTRGLAFELGAARPGRTVGFTVLVLAQLFNCFNARSEASSAFRGLLRNHWLWGAVGLSLLLQVAVVHVRVLNVAFNTVPLSASQWGVCIAMSSVVLWFSELRKWIFRRRG